MASVCETFHSGSTIYLICAALLVSIVETTDAPYGSLFSPLCGFALPPLPYDADALEPYIDAATVKVHHQGHHKSYTNKLNAVLDDWIMECHEDNTHMVHMLQHLENVPVEFRRSFINNGGGFVNHNIYWSVMSPNPSKTDRKPGGKLLEDINEAFGTYASFKEEFTGKALALFGSGYVWLSRKKDNSTKGSSLVITTTANQDSPISDGLQPLLVIDLWEHAYYLKHQNLRPKHIADWWMVVDWFKVAEFDGWWASESKKTQKAGLKQNEEEHDEL